MTRLDRMLGGGADEAQVARMWAGIGARRSARARRTNVTRPLAIVAAAAAIVFVVFALRKPGPLATRDGSGVHAWSVPAGEAPRVVTNCICRDTDSKTLTSAPRTRPDRRSR